MSVTTAAFSFSQKKICNLNECKSGMKSQATSTQDFTPCKMSLHLFWGPSPTRYSMTRSTAPLSLGRIGLANGGPGGWRPVKSTYMEMNTHEPTQDWWIQVYIFQFTDCFYNANIAAFTPRCIHRLHNLPTPGIGEQGVLGTAPWRTEADRADLSGGPPGAERGTGSVGKATWIEDTHRFLKELSQRQLDLPFVPVALDFAPDLDYSESAQTD